MRVLKLKNMLTEVMRVSISQFCRIYARDITERSPAHYRDKRHDYSCLLFPADAQINFWALRRLRCAR